MYNLNKWNHNKFKPEIHIVGDSTIILKRLFQIKKYIRFNKIKAIWLFSLIKGQDKGFVY